MDILLLQNGDSLLLQAGDGLLLQDTGDGVTGTGSNFLAVTRRTAKQMRPKQRTKQPRSTIRGFFD